MARWCSLACRRPEQLTFLLLHDPCLLQHLFSVALLTPLVAGRGLSALFILLLPSIQRAKTHVHTYMCQAVAAAAKRRCRLYIATHAQSRERKRERERERERERSFEREASRIIISKPRSQLLFSAFHLSQQLPEKFQYGQTANLNVNLAKQV